MPTYRIYHVQRRGTVIPRGEFDFETDGVALAKLSEFAGPDLAAELWEGSRCRPSPAAGPRRAALTQRPRH